MNRLWRVFLVTAVLLAGALLVAACGGGGGDDDDGNGDQPDATEQVDNGDDEPNGDANADLRRLASEFGNRELKVSYLMTTTSIVDGEEVVEEGTITFYWKPDVGWRMDLAFGDEGTVAFITANDTTYSCFEGDGESQCLEVPLGEELPVPFLSFLTDPGEFDDFIDSSVLGLGLDFSRSERSVAGRDAECFSAEGTIDGEDGQVEYCFADGIVLLIRTSGGGDFGGAFSLEATEISDSVSDSDLEPPYEVIDLGLDDLLDDFDLDDLLDDIDLDDILGE